MPQLDLQFRLIDLPIKYFQMRQESLHQILENAT